MKIVPLFLCALPLFSHAVFAQTPQAASLARLAACGLTVELPPAFVIAQSASESLRAQTGGLPRWNLIAYCAPNQFRTDRNESTLAGYRQSGDYLRGKEDLELPGGYNAVVLRRTPAAQPVQRIEVFFSSREFLYHFVLVPDHRNVSPEEWKKMQDALASALGSLQIENQVPAITERAYTVRLLAFAGVSLAFFSAALWVLLRRVVRSKK